MMCFENFRFQFKTNQSIFALLKKTTQHMTTLSSLTAVSPIDGRYHAKTVSLAPFFSEEALIKYRVLVEIEYFIALCELPLPQLTEVDTKVFESLRNIYKEFSTHDALEIKETEKVTNHDVKAVEYFIKNKFDALNLSQFKEFIHFGLTSQDINNTAIPLSTKEAFEKVYLPILVDLIAKLKSLSQEWKDIPMLARTHGQPASPTRLGKEIWVFVERLEEQLRFLFNIPFAAKFGGATGNFNAHHVAYPNIDWKQFGTTFVENNLGLHHSFPTTQIEHYDHFASFFDALKRINTIIIDLDRDIWTYVSMDYFKQKIKAGEIGSSAMPHKVNPIDFENSEGNLGIANAIFEHLSAKLPVSRLQRDLTDSTVLRNIGVPFGHTLIAFEATLKGLNKLVLNTSKLEDDLENNWAVVAEAIQTILRREAYPNPYEALKGLTRTHETINQKSIHQFIETLDVSEEIKAELKQITPHNYFGI
jgi:adenylosuccinate lyase